MKIVSVVGARPNFIKVIPFIQAINSYNTQVEEKLTHKLVHTGQHYDIRLSESFFMELNIPDPDYNLNIGSGSHAEQVGYTLIEFEKVLLKERPDWVILYGDVNATIACAITAKKSGTKICHIEAGLRSFDMTMPEEINRIVTDRLSDLLLTPDRGSSANLLSEGILNNKIVFVGNIMIDTLLVNFSKIEKLNLNSIINNNKSSGCLSDYKLGESYGIVTLHRPSNVDDPAVLENLCNFFIKDVNSIKLFWPVHPRTVNNLKKFNLYKKILEAPHIIILEPVSYIEMIALIKSARIIFTDSGGLQEESAFLGTPCLTLRQNTERPITLIENGGTCKLVGNDAALIKYTFNKMLMKEKVYTRPEFSDGETAKRCLSAILSHSS